jgi:hypothetical protein
LQAEDAYTLTARQAGTVDVELLDDELAVLATRSFTVAAADHLEATIEIVRASSTTQLDRVVVEQPVPVPAGALVRLTVDARRGAEPLSGWSEYTFDAQLTNGAEVQRWDREGHATLRLAAGDQAVRFTSTSTALDGRFVLAAR